MSDSYPSDPVAFYDELTSRNRHFISRDLQARLGNLKFLVAGCGSTGGACIESLARLGVRHFALADSGAYELNNLNRQHATLKDLGENKAAFHARQLRGINPHAEVRAHPEGLTLQNVAGLVEWAELIMDGVDVTTRSGIAMKLALHEHAKRLRKPVLTALDIGYHQWGKTYDYRDPGQAVLDGKLEAALRARHPMKALFSFVPLRAVPTHALPLIRDLLKNEDVSASQLGGTSDQLSAIIAPVVRRFVETGEVAKGWSINLEFLALSRLQRLSWLVQRPRLYREVSRLLRETE